MDRTPEESCGRNRSQSDYIREVKSSNDFTLFSDNEFVEVVAQRSVVRIVMTMREPFEERMKRISDKILDMLTEEKNDSFDRE